jgi:hypothetical protein
VSAAANRDNHLPPITAPSQTTQQSSHPDQLFFQQLLKVNNVLDGQNFKPTAKFRDTCRKLLKYAEKLSEEHTAMYQHYFKTAVTNVVRKLGQKDEGFDWWNYDSITDRT